MKAVRVSCCQVKNFALRWLQYQVEHGQFIQISDRQNEVGKSRVGLARVASHFRSCSRQKMLENAMESDCWTTSISAECYLMYISNSRRHRPIIEKRDQLISCVP